MSALRAIAPAFTPPLAVKDNGPLRAATDIKHRRTAAAAADTSFDRNVIPFRRSKASLRSARPFRAYDGLGQLLTNTGFWGPSNNLITASATYDSLGNIRSKGFGNRVVSLAYDTDNGNVNGKNRVIQSLDSQPAPIVGAPKISGEGAGGTGTRTVAYDNRGNVTTLGTMAFYYDYSDQPTTLALTKPDGTLQTGNYRYDGHLKRVRNQVNGKTIYNVFDASGKLVHTRDITQDKTADYIIANGETVARWGKDHWIFDHQDHLGSTVAATHMNGNVNARIRYAPFGLMMDDPKKLRDGAGYTGHLKDSETGLNYMQARYYDPVMGRFLSIDAMDFMGSGGNPQYFNRYAYTFNDPINLVDPDGMQVTTTLRSYPIKESGGIVSHAYVHIQDTQSGNGLIIRGGPSVPYLAGSRASTKNLPQQTTQQFTSDGTTIELYNTTTLTMKSDPNPETNYDYNQPGQNVVNSFTSDESFETVTTNALTAAGAINDQLLPYLPQGPSNSNGGANTVYRAATGGQSGLPASRPSTTPQFNSPIQPAMPGIRDDLLTPE